MRLLPVGAQEHSDWEDGLWVEKPGYPCIDCSWIHQPPEGHCVPEFEFEEGHDKNKNEPAPVFYVGSGEDCHVRLGDELVPERVCRVYKEGRNWLLEALLPHAAVHLGDRSLAVGQRVMLKDGDTFTLARPPTPFAYRIKLCDEDNWYVDLQSEKDYPNKYPGRFPFRSSLPEAPQAPEELKRLAWQTDQMRRRSEEDQVRVADWSAFSQYVKRHYYKHGIECIPWCTTGRLRAIDEPLVPLQPRAYPSWIGELMARERQLPGVDPTRPLAFQSCMEASGLKVAPQMQFKGEPPRLEDLYTDSFASGLAVASTSAPSRGVGLTINGAPLPGPGESDAERAALMEEAPTIPSVEEVPSVNPHLRQPFKLWLQGMDDSMFLMQYHDQIVANFDSLEQVHEIYFRDGELSKAFFEDTSIKKLGHRRIFEKWFRDFCR